MSRLCLLTRAEDRSTILPETIAALLPACTSDGFEIVVVEHGAQPSRVRPSAVVRILRQPKVGYDQPITASPLGRSADVVFLDDYRDFHRSEDITRLEAQIAATAI